MYFALQHYLQRSADRQPEQVAVVDGDRHLSYAELDRQSDELAAILWDIGVRNGHRVGVYADKSLETVAAIYGILKSGAAYVPLDPSAPAKRLAYMAADCGAEVLISGRERAGTWPALLFEGAPFQTFVLTNGEPDDVPMITGATVVGVAAGKELPHPPASANISLDLAYILYTSGSTGSPKGVMLTHRNAMTFVEWAVDEFGLMSDDVLSSHAPFTFDLSVFDLFAAAKSGATLVLVPPKFSVFPVNLAQFITSHRITVWYSVPSILSVLVRHAHLSPGDLPHLRTVLFAGEVFPTKYLRSLMRLLPGAQFCNLYGPTETNVCTYYWVPPLADHMDRSIPIGRAIGDVETFVITDDGRVAGVGELGELYVRGTTVMQGYWGDAARTSHALVPDPRGGALGDRAYRTGDLVIGDEDGNYEFLGRRDAQIKSRGYRIELGEIESTLYAHNDVVECAAVAVPDPLIGNRVQAFVSTRGGKDDAALRRFCADRLPGWMVPERFEIRASLPKTMTGKIDRQALLKEASGQSTPEGGPT